MAQSIIQGLLEHIGPAAEAVDNEPADACPFLLVENLHGPDDGGEHPAAVDVPDQQDWRLGVLGHLHIDDIVGFEIYFSRATGTLQKNGVEFPGQGIVAFLDLFEGLLPVSDVIRYPQILHRFAAHDDLVVNSTILFEQQGIHAHVRIKAGGQGLNRLGVPHFLAVVGDVGRSWHGLGLERSDAVAVL